jgi:hypothetical protein
VTEFPTELPTQTQQAATWFPWSRALARRVVPKSRYARIFLATTLVAALAAWCFWYKPWQAHYQGLPSSYWAGVLLAKHRAERTGSGGGNYSTGMLAAFHGWISATFGGGAEFTGADFEKVLGELLLYPDPEVRRVAAARLSEFGSRGRRLAMPILLNDLRTNSDVRNREHTAQTLQSSSAVDPNTVRPFIHELLHCHEGEDDQSIRNAIVNVLRNLDPRSGDWPPLLYDVRFSATPSGPMAVDGWGPINGRPGEGGDWTVVADPTTPSRAGFALAQRSSVFFIHRFVDLYTRARNVSLRVHIKAILGNAEQGGGVLWRCCNFARYPYAHADVYYAAGVNPADGSLRLYKVTDGDRVQLAASEGLKVSVGEWHELHVKHVGDKIECSLDGTKYIEVTNALIPGAGQVGLWTKADAQTYFDGLHVTDYGPASEP